MVNLEQKYYNILVNVFNSYCPKAQIWAYGGRVKESSHSRSDLDLIVRSFNETGKRLCELKELLNDSDIPFLVDINEFEKLSGSMQKEIEKNYVEIFPEHKLGKEVKV